MKERGYRVQIEENHISVEHRASFRPYTIMILAIAYLTYCLIPAVKHILVDFYSSGDPVIGGFALLMLLIPFLSGATWLFFASGEVMHCDSHELHFARRRTWGRWHRFRFPCADIRNLRKAFRGGSRSRTYSVLTFECDRQTFDMLENLDRKEANRVLLACKSLGVDIDIPADGAEEMLDDIEKRGWLVNPWKSDRG